MHIAAGERPGEAAHVDPRLWRQCLERRRTSPTYLHDLYPSADVVAFHYRGYRPSTGTPSAEALLDDAPLVYDFAVDRVKPDRTIAVGFSIGSGVAASLARERPVDGLILVTPFDSLEGRGQRSLSLGCRSAPLFRHDMDAAAALKASKVPIAIIAAEHDELIRAARTDGLRAAVAQSGVRPDHRGSRPQRHLRPVRISARDGRRAGGGEPMPGLAPTEPLAAKPHSIHIPET